ncbi:MAG: efflux RND transporter periplasmic adaptor subunit [Proteobacteria bacterium]|nr:efflux RND transporter periplasmic adaptor subunit [Pseudomonadota bacterium]
MTARRFTCLPALLSLLMLAACSSGSDTPAPPSAAAEPAAPAKPALTVTVVSPESREVDRRLAANGSVAAWQEASLGAESGGLRLAAVKASVGDRVKRGELLAEFAAEVPLAEQAQARASLAEAEAALAEARANAARARSVDGTGALSPQQLQQYLTAETAADARVKAARAGLDAADLRVRHTRVVASDDGVISFRAPVATLGAVVPQGQELYRLIRQHRLEWRAEVPAAELTRLKVGQKVVVTPPAGGKVTGVVRTIAPTVDSQTRNALVYVDLPASAGNGADAPLKAGMFARGEFELGKGRGLTLPRQAVAMRDGFNFIFLVGADQRVTQTKVDVGYRDAERVGINTPLPAGARVVASGAGFLSDGDLVQVTAAGSSATKGK